MKNVNTPKQRVFFRHALPISLAIHPVFLRQIGFAWRKNPSLLGIFPLFKQRLIINTIKFEWDGNKNRINRRKHGLSFDEAKAVFL